MSRATTPKPPAADPEVSVAAPKENGNGQDAAQPDSNGDAQDKNSEKTEGPDQPAAPAAGPTKSTPLELPVEVRAKLRKLEKLEATYPGLLYLYRLRASGGHG